MVRKAVIPFVLMLILALAFLSNPTVTVADKGATIDEKIAQASALSENGAVGMELSQEEIREFLLARGYSQEEAEGISGHPGRVMAGLQAVEENNMETSK